MNILENLKSDYNVFPYETEFVVQQHASSNLHFDLRIRKGNVAPSWAIPKAKLPTKPNEKYLAIRTEDHSLSFMTFFGKIPKNNYGAGTVKQYDSGNCIVYTWSNNYIVVKLIGNILTGFYALIRMKKDQWLITYMNQENAIARFEGTIESFNVENNYYNTKFSFFNAENLNQILEIDKETQFYCIAYNEDELKQYINDTFNMFVENLELIDEQIDCFVAGLDIESHSIFEYKIFLDSNILLKESYNWKNQTGGVGVNIE